jgi:hypothetical protein
MNLKTIDTFINDFSIKINKLIRFEMNDNTLNSKRHQLLFNDILYELFKRKKFGLDYDLWNELYLRSLCFYKYKNKIGDIPLVLVTKHNEILPFYFKHKIHKNTNTFIHWDTHPDFNELDFSLQLPNIYSNYLKTHNNDLINKAQKLVWDIGAANSGVFMATGIRDTIWCMPSWLPDKEANINYFFKKNKNTYTITTNSVTDKKSVLEEFIQGKNNGEEIKTYSKIQAEKMSKKSLENILLMIKNNSNKYILDIDLDYFVCNGSKLNKSYFREPYDVSSQHRTENVDYNQALPRGIDKDNHKYFKYEHDLKIEVYQINKRITHFLNVLKYIKKKGFIPSHISVCDSTNVHFSGCQTCNSVSNNYVPLNLALYVHTKVLIGLTKIFE